MLFRLTGIILVVITVGAVVAHHAGWALPTLDWFFSFEAKEEGLESASWGKKYQANIIGYILCALLMSVGVLCLRTKSRKVNWNPQTLRKLKRFRSITRGYVSLWILVGLLFFRTTLLLRTIFLLGLPFFRIDMLQLRRKEVLHRKHVQRRRCHC